MGIRRGEIWWAELGDPVGSAPGFRRPVVVVQSSAINRSAIRTVVVVTLTTNLRLANAPGNVLASGLKGLPKSSVVNVSQILAIDKSLLTERIGALPPAVMARVDDGLRLVLAL